MTEYFYFDGVPSSQLGIQIIQAGGGAEDTFPLLGAQTFYEQQVINNDFSSFIRTRKERLQFTLAFMLIGCPPGAPEAVTGQVNDDNLWQLGQFFARSKPIEFMLATDNMIGSQRIVARRVTPPLTGGVGANTVVQPGGSWRWGDPIPSGWNPPGEYGLGDIRNATSGLMTGGGAANTDIFLRRVPGTNRRNYDSIITAVPRVLYIVPTGGIEFQRYIGNKAVWQITFDATTPYWMTPKEELRYDFFGTPAFPRTFNITNLRNIQDRSGNYDVFPKITIETVQRDQDNSTEGGRSPIIITNEPRSQVRLESTNPSSIRDILSGTNNTITMHHRIVQSTFDQHEWIPPSRTNSQQYWIFDNWNKVPFSLVGGVVNNGQIGRNNLTINRACNLIVEMQVPIF